MNAPWFDALEEQAGLHELNEAMRIAESWRHRNEDAAEILRHVSNARETYLALAAALRERESSSHSDPVA